jgi:hypothetical protein
MRKDDEEARPSGPPVTTYVVPLDQNLIRYLRAYWRYRHSTGSSIEDWNSVTLDEFDAFRINPDFDIESLEAARAPSTPSAYTVMDPTPHRAVTPRQQTPAEIFRRGIKRDQSLFPTLKDEHFNDSWHRSFVNQARAQGLSDVLVATFTPTSTEQIDSFANNSYICTRFSRQKY